jgi:hypothetical protein
MRPERLHRHNAMLSHCAGEVQKHPAEKEVNPSLRILYAVRMDNKRILHTCRSHNVFSEYYNHMHPTTLQYHHRHCIPITHCRLSIACLWRCWQWRLPVVTTSLATQWPCEYQHDVDVKSLFNNYTRGHLRVLGIPNARGIPSILGLFYALARCIVYVSGSQG